MKKKIDVETASSIPISLYVHIPWCVKKCPYCDFNSHEASMSFDEQGYINALINDLEVELPHIHDRLLISIFIRSLESGFPLFFTEGIVLFLQ